MSHRSTAAAAAPRAFATTPGKVGMWLFLASDGMGFMGLIGAYMVLRIAAGRWQQPGDPTFGIPLTAFMTFVLICSSVTMVKALAAIRKDSRRGLLVWLGMTILGGLVFLGLQAYEWTHLIHEGLRAAKSNYGATFFMLTGFHGLHVTCGVVYLGCIWVRGRMGAYSRTRNSPVELAGLYWHFVDLVWIVLFTIIYLLPEPRTA
ncbi:MAG: heme-copper oxidase subunit III [Planctomycetota bacterium]